MGKIMYSVGSTGLALFLLFGLASCNKADSIVIVEAPTSVYEDYPTDGPPRSRIIATINSGETFEIINIRYAKDAQYLKIRLKDGRTGYIGWDGKYKVVPKTKTPKT